MSFESDLDEIFYDGMLYHLLYEDIDEAERRKMSSQKARHSETQSCEYTMMKKKRKILL